MIKALAASLLFLVSAGTALAEQGQGMNMKMEHGMKMEHASSTHLQVGSSTNPGHSGPRDGIATATPRGMDHSSTTPHEGFGRGQGSGQGNGHGKPMNGAVLPHRGATPGIVASVGSNSFTMTLLGNRERATTTLTVQVDSATTFLRASTTAGLSSLTVGSKVVVIGKYSTTTKSITALRVVINGDGERRAEMQRDGVWNHLKTFFGGARSGSSTDEMKDTLNGGTDGGPATKAPGFMAKLRSALFGWL